MNPLECAFRVSSRKFLGFLVHNRGIDVDLAKAMAIATIKPPATVKELKSFLGKVSLSEDSSLDWHQLLLLSANYSRRDKAASGEKHKKRPSKGYNRL